MNSWYLRVTADIPKGQADKHGVLWYPRVRYCFDENNEMFSRHDCARFLQEVVPNDPFPEFDSVTPYLGRIGQSVEGGGKRRLFAIGNWVNQRLLHPFHKWLMELLRTLPMDGTFNQTRPLERLVGAKTVYSVDLKSATDRWPFLFQNAFVDGTYVCSWRVQAFGWTPIYGGLGENP